MPAEILRAEKNQNLGPGDPEIPELAPEIFPGHLNIFDLSHGRTLLQPGDQVFQAVLFTFGQNLDAAVTQVPDPARETQRGRPAPGVIAEEDSLDAARNKDTSPGFHRTCRYANIAWPGRKVLSSPIDRIEIND